MKNHSVRMGWLSPLFTVCMMCLAVLTVLAYTTARAENALAQKQAQTVTQAYALECEAQQWLAQTEAQAAAGTLPEGELTQQFTGTGRELRVSVEVQDGICTVTRWQSSAVWTDEAQTETLWGAAASSEG